MQAAQAKFAHHGSPAAFYTRCSIINICRSELGALRLTGA
jgi:hypothetical protein